MSFHCDTEKCYEVHHENWPEYRDVEQLKERAEECNGRGLGGRIPELELWQTADERSELFILTCWKTWAVFFRLVLRHSGVNLGREEGQQQVQVVDCERICNYIPSLPTGRTLDIVNTAIQLTWANKILAIKAIISTTVNIHLLMAKGVHLSSIS